MCHREPRQFYTWAADCDLLPVVNERQFANALTDIGLVPICRLISSDLFAEEKRVHGTNLLINP